LNSSLFNLLRNGGYVLYTKHGEATVGEDQPNLNFHYCITQRNFSEVGRRQAIYYGEVLRMLKIPVSYPILVSPFCRAIETGQLAFGEEKVTKSSLNYL
jgi:phosphohistidine phosphatase SixA